MNTLNRTIAREYSFKFLYYYFDKIEGSTEELETLIKGFNETINDSESETQIKISGSNYNYAISIIENSLSNRDKIKEKLISGLTNWKFERIDKIDLAAIFVGTCEMLFIKNRPATKIIINEAVMLVKEYGSEKSPAFVNGILDKIARTEGKL